MASIPQSLHRALPRCDCYRQAALRRFFINDTTNPLYHLRWASSAPIRDKSRIIEKPTRFNPPSHGSRKVRKAGPRGTYDGSLQYGRELTDDEKWEMNKKRYPNMMPPKGSFMWKILTDRRLHLWITLSTLTCLAIYASFLSFLTTTEFRDELPSPSDFLKTPFSSSIKFVDVYKRHTAWESEKIAEKRRQRNADITKRKEFLQEHGVEPGFLTGSWMDKFGTVEGDQAREKMRLKKEQEEALRLQQAQEAVQVSPAEASVGEEDEQPRPKKKKVKMWLGIW